MIHRLNIPCPVTFDGKGSNSTNGIMFKKCLLAQNMQRAILDNFNKKNIVLAH